VPANVTFWYGTFFSLFSPLFSELFRSSLITTVDGATILSEDVFGFGFGKRTWVFLMHILVEVRSDTFEFVTGFTMMGVG